MLRRKLTSIVKTLENGRQVCVVTIDACPRLALVDLQQFEELCYQVESLRQ